jgi:hypothetical protein
MSATLYETDYYAWIQDQVARLRAMAGDNRIDAELLAEEIEDLGKSEFRAVKSYLALILEHFLKIEYAEDSRSVDHWKREIQVFRDNLQDYLTPSLRKKSTEIIGRCYRNARLNALNFIEENNTGTEPSLPEDCPYTLDQVLDPDWFPDPGRD